MDIFGGPCKFEGTWAVDFRLGINWIQDDSRDWCSLPLICITYHCVENRSLISVCLPKDIQHKKNNLQL